MRSALDRVQGSLSFMSHPAHFSLARDPLPDHEQKQAALSYLNEAWAEARHDGVAVGNEFAAMRVYVVDACLPILRRLGARAER